jgi:hypothetical protein
MDTSTVVGIAISLFSITVSISLGIIALIISSKSDKTLASIHTEINALRSDFIRLHEQVLSNHHDYATAVMDAMKVLVQMQVHKGELINEETDDIEEELKEAIKVLRRPSPDPASILSKQSKLGK